MGGPAEQAFGRVIRELRTVAGWSQEKLAEASSTTRGYISLLERGVNSVTIDMIFRLATAFNTTPSEMLHRTEALMSEGSLPEESSQDLGSTQRSGTD